MARPTSRFPRPVVFLSSADNSDGPSFRGLLPPVPQNEELLVQRFETRAGRIWEDCILPALSAAKGRAVSPTRAASRRIHWDNPHAGPVASQAIIQALGATHHLEGRARALCVAASELGFTLAAYQQIIPNRRRIETIAGYGEALSWVGVAEASHPIDLDPSERHPRDIQAEVASSAIGRVIRGSSPLFDSDLYTRFHHENALRAFFPVGRFRRTTPAIGRSPETEADLEWEFLGEGDNLRFTPLVPEDFRFEVFGTLEVGFLEGREQVITRDQLQSILALIAHHVPSLYPSTLKGALEEVCEVFQSFTGAEAASLHLVVDPCEAPQCFTFNVVSGRARAMATVSTNGGGGISDPPRRDGRGLGQRAVTSRAACCIPDRAAGHAIDELRRSNPNVWDRHGVRSMAAFPLLAEPDATEPAGVLYVHYFQPQFLDRELLNRGYDLAQRIAREVQFALARIEQRERVRQNESLLQLVLSSLTVDAPRVNIKDVTRNARMVLGSDILCIARRDANAWINPTVSGRTKQTASSNISSAIAALVPTVAAHDRLGEGCFSPTKDHVPWLGEALYEAEGVQSAAGLAIYGQQVDVQNGSHQRNLLGVMYVGFRTYHALQEGEVGVIRLLGKVVGAILGGDPPRLAGIEIGETLDRLGCSPSRA